MKPVFARAIGIALDDDRRHVVVQTMARHALERGDVQVPQRLEPLVVDELQRENPSTTTNAYQRSPSTRNSAQSTCICWPGAVSKRTTGSVFTGVNTVGVTIDQLLAKEAGK